MSRPERPHDALVVAQCEFQGPWLYRSGDGDGRGERLARALRTPYDVAGLRRQRRCGKLDRARAPARRTTAGGRVLHAALGVERAPGAAIALAVGLAGHLDPQVARRRAACPSRWSAARRRRGPAGCTSPPHPGRRPPGYCHGPCPLRLVSMTKCVVGSTPPSDDAYRDSMPSVFSAGQPHPTLHSAVLRQSRRRSSRWPDRRSSTGCRTRRSAWPSSVTQRCTTRPTCRSASSSS